MFFIDPRLHWQSILILTIVQLIIVFCYGLFLRTIVHRKYRYPTPLYHLYKCNDYSPQSNYDFLQYPQYTIVLVKFNSDRIIESETYYTKLGDIVCFEYENNRRISSKEMAISNLVLAVFLIPGCLMFVGLILLNFIHLVFDINFDFLLTLKNTIIEVFGISLLSTLISLFLKPIIPLVNTSCKLSCK